MSRAKQAMVGSVGFALLVSAAVACSANGSADLFGGDRSSAEADAGANAADSPSAGAVGALATGVVLVHAASFPSFRLCFANTMKQVPVPDTRILPESNVVGVETGGFIRLPTMDATGTIYVIDERVVRNHTETCDRLINGGLLHKGNDYDVIDADADAGAALNAPLGKNGVDLVVLSGCASGNTLDNLGVSPTACGSSYASLDGNLGATVTRLQRTPDGASPSRLPVQLYQLSTRADALGKVEVSFGELASTKGALGQALGVPPLFGAGAQTSLDVDQTNEAVYGTYGFRIAVGGFSVDESLATVQQLSSANELPTSYYATASNYALLLLGDPAYPSDAGAASTHLGMHLLAVPVLDPSAQDAGADAAASDAGH